MIEMLELQFPINGKYEIEDNKMSEMFEKIEAMKEKEFYFALMKALRHQGYYFDGGLEQVGFGGWRVASDPHLTNSFYCDTLFAKRGAQISVDQVLKARTSAIHRGLDKVTVFANSNYENEVYAVAMSLNINLVGLWDVAATLLKYEIETQPEQDTQ